MLSEHAAHHMHPRITYCIDFLTRSPFGRAERYYFYSGTCAFSSHRAQVLNLEPAEIYLLCPYKSWSPAFSKL